MVTKLSLVMAQEAGLEVSVFVEPLESLLEVRFLLAMVECLFWRSRSRGRAILIVACSLDFYWGAGQTERGPKEVER